VVWGVDLTTIRGRKVVGEAAVIAESFEVAALLFLLGELAIHPDAQVGAVRVCPWKYPIATHCSFAEPSRADIMSSAKQADLLATSPD